RRTPSWPQVDLRCTGPPPVDGRQRPGALGAPPAAGYPPDRCVTPATLNKEGLVQPAPDAYGRRGRARPVRPAARLEVPAREREELRWLTRRTACPTCRTTPPPSSR